MLLHNMFVNIVSCSFPDRLLSSFDFPFCKVGVGKVDGVGIEWGTSILI